ncbi:MAG TPA: DUF1127 domain-containing protein [Aliidongia sp.]|uniref:DUF1127 domain-containing protein n=1 Tax=Aliidongia sp. TaxID=1914230 RepID=UPI002DDD8CFF|nr:DUF1127 domain-containing protein [Aliidongia sp.]HEV2676600.1 DUF1127 domain-containing protein [Aliidongia sp.]
MTKLTMTAGSAALSRGTTSHHVAGFATRMFDAIGAWGDRAAQRRLLSAASDHVLHDIGISRLDAEGEVEKPFWRR